MTVNLHEFRLEPDNAVELFSQYDLILDGTDNFATRYLVNDAAVLAGKPYVWGSIYRFEGQVSVFWEDAPTGWASITATSIPSRRHRAWCPRAPRAGCSAYSCASIASVMGTEAIKLITGIGEPAAAAASWSTTRWRCRTGPSQIRKDPATPKITELIDYEAFCGVVSDEAAAAAAGSTITLLELAGTPSIPGNRWR